MAKLNTINIQELPLYLYESKNKSQNKLIDIIDNNQITFAKGNAGSGKTFSTLAYALNKLYKREFDKLVIIKPLVESEESIGYLPGSVDSKVFPYHNSTLFTLDELIGKEQRIDRIKEGTILIEPIALLRGVTFNNSIIIIDEAQNTTVNQVKLILTRIGKNSKMIFIGDVDQTDRKGTTSGLKDGVDRFNDMDDVGIFSFDKDDNVRNEIISKILNRYDE